MAKNLHVDRAIAIVVTMKSPVTFTLVVFLLAAGCAKDDSASTEPDLTLHAPSELSVVRLDITSLRLTWKDNTGAEEGFVVERQEGQAKFVPHLFTARDVTVAIDSVGLLRDSTYSYRVQAIRYSDRSLFSNVARISLTMPFP